MSEKESGNTGAAESCLFCAIQTDDRKRIVEENDYAYAIRDGFPVTPGHTLFIPKRHVPDYFGLTQEERDAINLLIYSQKKILETEDPTIEGWNPKSSAIEPRKPSWLWLIKCRAASGTVGRASRTRCSSASFPAASSRRSSSRSQTTRGLESGTWPQAIS